VYAQYTVSVDERDRIQAVLHAAAIPTAVHYPVPIHMQPAYVHLCCEDCCPVARDMAARVMSLPMGPYLPAAASHQVAAVLLRAAGVRLPGTDQREDSLC
jgi:UDP-2-acetamido-2-deoxy-ribo-hexuluronate aminotransferase